MDTLQGDWAMVPSQDDRLTHQEIFSKTYEALADRVEQDVGERGIFNFAGGAHEVERVVKESYDPRSFISGAQPQDFVFRDSLMAMRDVHSVTVAMKRILDTQPIISTDRLRDIYNVAFMLPKMSSEQIRELVTHGMDEAHQRALNRVIELARKILADPNNKVSLSDLSKQLGSHLFLPLDYYSNIETSLVYRENGVKKGRPLAASELATGGVEMDRRERINRLLFEALLAQPEQV
ncbi:MAG: hypothetical protein KDK64_06730 [Chlamydiia bacterium]|nr:hypothetical protein [Chlamydiia bacterium]